MKSHKTIMLNKKAQSDSNLIFAIAILIFGSALVIMWSVSEALGYPQISIFARWGIALFVFFIEFAQWVINKVK